MINLIPNEEKKKKLKDFYFRLLVVFFVVLGSSILVASVAILPAYFFSSAKKSSTNDKLMLQGSKPVPALDQKTMAIIKDLNDKLNLVEKTQASKYLVSQKIINQIMTNKIPDIKIIQILFQNDPVKGKTVNINGIASSRERLLLFSKILRDNVAFKEVDLPISNFVRGSNIIFYLSLIPYEK